MKKTRLLFLFLYGTLALTFIACDTKKDPEDSKDIAEEHNDAKFDKAKEKDAQFLVDAADIAMQEIKLSELAQSQAEADDIKELGKFIKEDYTKSLKEIEGIANKKMVTLPTSISAEGEDNAKKLSDKQGKPFDQEYSSEMVDLHEKAIDKFEKASTDSEDYEIKSWATKKLTELRTNLDRSMVCRDKYKDKKEDRTKDKTPITGPK
jgi:putative membrane protein